MNNLKIASQIKVIDNFFPLIIQKQIIQDYFKNSQINWSYNTTISKNNEDAFANKLFSNWEKHGNVEDTDGFSYQIMIDDPNNDYIFKNIKLSAKKYFNIDIETFLRVMVVFYPPNPLYDDKNHLYPHIDRFSPHKNLLYYVTDNDADTLFFNQEYDPKLGIDFTKQEIIYRVSPKQGRAVLFDGFIFHAGNVSKLNKRLTLNINFK